MANNDDDSNLGLKILGYTLHLLVFILNIVVIVFVIFIWKRRDLVIMFTVWLLLLAACFQIVIDFLIVYKKLNERQEDMLFTTYTSLLFGTHLLLGMQYLYSSFIMPLIINEIKLSVNVESTDESSHNQEYIQE